MKRQKKNLLGARPTIVVSQVALMMAALPGADATATDAPVWVQVAEEGTFKGYQGGEFEFTFDLNLFKQVVTNFRRSKNYRLGPNGYGDRDVVAWDFHHASEMPAVTGTIPVTGTPAQGWIQDLDVRRSESGKLGLWALTRWLEPARTYIKEERYKWASVSIVFDAVDAISGKSLGPMLTSVALTNQPFIEGMQQLAADKLAAGHVKLRSCGMYVERADSPEDALESIRRLLGMPETSDAVAVLAELEKVKQWIASGTTPLGVDLDDIVGGVRTILNLPALSSNEEVMGEVDKLITRLAETSGVEGGAMPAPVPGAAPAAPAEPNIPPGAPALSKENAMSFLKALADKLGVIAQEQAVLEALDGLVELRAIVASARGLDSTASTKVICKAAMTDNEVRAKFGPLLKALGVEDPDAALDKVGDLMTQSEELKKVAPELSALRKKAEEAEAEVADTDVEAAMASMSIAKTSEHYEGIKLAVTHYRKANTREDFFKKYPKAEANRAHLTRTISGGTSAGDDPAKVAASRTTTTETPKDAVDVSAFSGSNLMLKTCEFVRASVQGAQSWPWDKVHEHASALVRSKKVHMGKAA